MNDVLVKKEHDVRSKGMHLVTVCDVSTPEARAMEDQILDKINERKALLKAKFTPDELEEKLFMHWYEYNALMKRFNDRFMVRQVLIPNVTTTAGRTVLARRLSGNTTYTGIVNYTALGTDSTAATVAQVKLGTETYRKALSSGTFLANVAYLETFFTASEVSGTFQEYANFIDGTGSADSGQMFNRFTQAVTKSLTETLNVQSVVTFSDV